MMRVLRYDVPVDDQEHVIECGVIVHVDCRASDTVTFWTLDRGTSSRVFRVFATGQGIPEDKPWAYQGTALSPDLSPFLARGALVWHLFEKL